MIVLGLNRTLIVEDYSCDCLESGRSVLTSRYLMDRPMARQGRIPDGVEFLDDGS